LGDRLIAPAARQAASMRVPASEVGQGKREIRQRLRPHPRAEGRQPLRDATEHGALPAEQDDEADACQPQRSHRPRQGAYIRRRVPLKPPLPIDHAAKREKQKSEVQNCERVKTREDQSCRGFVQLFMPLGEVAEHRRHPASLSRRDQKDPIGLRQPAACPMKNIVDRGPVFASRGKLPDRRGLTPAAPGRRLQRLRQRQTRFELLRKLQVPNRKLLVTQHEEKCCTKTRLIAGRSHREQEARLGDCGAISELTGVTARDRERARSYRTTWC
jgi:hypothetical protein